MDGKTTEYLNDINLPYTQVLQTFGEGDKVQSTYTYGVQRIKSQGEINETYLYDWHGSVSGVVTEASEVTTYAYTAYGDLLPDSPQPSVYGYNAEATDYNTGLQYLRARYYNTNTGRFIQKDEYKGDFTQPGTLNRYAYCAGNPVNRIDPSGYYVTQADVTNAYNSYMTQVDKTEEYYTAYQTAKATYRENLGYQKNIESKLREAAREYRNAARMSSLRRWLLGIDLDSLRERVDALSETLINAASLASGSLACYNDAISKLEESEALEEAAKEHYEQLQNQYEKDLIKISSEEAIENGSANLSQNDPKWAEIDYGNSSYGDGGCLPTAIAIAFNYSGVTEQYTPVEIGKVIESHGNIYMKTKGGTRGLQYMIGGEIDGRVYPDKQLAKDFSFVTDVDSYSKEGYFISWIISSIDEQGSAILQYDKESIFTSSGHYMTAVGYDKDKRTITLVDPRNGRKRDYSYNDVAMGLDRTYKIIFNR